MRALRVAVGDDTVEAALVLLATIMPKGEGDGDIENGQIVRTIPEYVESYASPPRTPAT